VTGLWRFLGVYLPDLKPLLHTFMPSISRFCFGTVRFVTSTSVRISMGRIGKNTVRLYLTDLFLMFI
ncbi:hypothetical protein HDU76_007813, partial [Blyttiomyces sp. JEL0837]